MNAVITATILLVINPQMDFWTMLAYAIFIPVGFIGVIILMSIYQERFDKLRMTPKGLPRHGDYLNYPSAHRDGIIGIWRFIIWMKFYDYY
jgi:hypothetical protein